MKSSQILLALISTAFLVSAAPALPVDTESAGKAEARDLEPREPLGGIVEYKKHTAAALALGALAVGSTFLGKHLANKEAQDGENAEVRDLKDFDLLG